LSEAFKDSAATESLKLEIKRLQGLLDGANKMIDQLAAQISEKNDYIAKIEGKGIDLSSHMTDEEIITRKELERLKQKAILGELTLDDTRKLDLLVKNKQLAERTRPVEADYINLRDKSERKLLDLASKTPKKNVNE
jgi:hypothetical protein